MDGGTGVMTMTCDEAEVLLNALLDGELDAGHAREVEQHVATCARCTATLAAYRQMRGAGAASRRCRRRSDRTCSRCRRGAACCAALRWARQLRLSQPPAFLPSCCA